MTKGKMEEEEKKRLRKDKTKLTDNSHHKAAEGNETETREMSELQT